MKFISKKVLTEGMAANPLDKSVSEDQDVTSLAQQGILTAIAAETDAINQYDQIKDLVSRSEGWLNKKAMPVIEDIVSEEKKHLAQLTELVKQLPAYEEDMKKGEEETKSGEDISESVKKAIKESVEEKAEEAFAKYDSDIVIKIVTEESNVSAKYLYDLADALNLLGNLYPEQVDVLLSQIDFYPATLDRIENRIIEEADIKKNEINQQQADEKEALEYDLSVLKELLTDEDNSYYIKHPIIRQKIEDIIKEFEE